MTDPLPMMTLFDKQIQLRMGQANVKRWVDDLLPLLAETTTCSASRTFATPPPPARGRPGRLRDVPEEADGAVKVIFQPDRPPRPVGHQPQG